MPNGYSVSNATKRLIRQEKERKAKESGESRGGSRYDDPSTGGGADDEENAKMNHGQVTGKMVIKHLANGEQRMCVELADRLKREELLRRFGLLPPNEEAGRKQQADERKQKTRHNRARSPGDDYGDDFESAPEDDPYGDDAFDHHEGDVAGGGADQENSHKKTAPGTCEMSLWSTKDRRVGLQYMMDITKDLREEEALKTLIANGKAPNAPRCWIQFEKKMDVQGKNRFSNDASVTGGGGGGGRSRRRMGQRQEMSQVDDHGDVQHLRDRLVHRHHHLLTHGARIQMMLQPIRIPNRFDVVVETRLNGDPLFPTETTIGMNHGLQRTHPQGDRDVFE
eukprot:gene32019-41207_t